MALIIFKVLEKNCKQTSPDRAHDPLKYFCKAFTIFAIEISLQRDKDMIVEVFFTISFYSKLLYSSSMKASVNRTTHFTLIVHWIELHAAFEERENKQKNANFYKQKNVNF